LAITLDGERIWRDTGWTAAIVQTLGLCSDSTSPVTQLRHGKPDDHQQQAADPFKVE